MVHCNMHVAVCVTPVMLQFSATCPPPPPAAAAAAAAGVLCGGTTVSRSLGTRRSFGYSLPPLQILCVQGKQIATHSRCKGYVGHCQQVTGHCGICILLPVKCSFYFTIICSLHLLSGPSRDCFWVSFGMSQAPQHKLCQTQSCMCLCPAFAISTQHSTHVPPHG
jgi:hypothetical protein